VRSLVLGGSVFVGRRLVDGLQREGHAVTVLNRGRTPTHLPDDVSRLVADRTDTSSLRTVLEGTEWDAIFDVSGFVMAAGGGDIADLLDLLEGRVGSYVYVSSIMAYDQSLTRPPAVVPTPWTEDLPTNPDGPTTYGGFKALAEAAMTDRYRSTGFPVTIVRPAAIYGPANNIYDMETPMFLRLLRDLPILLPHDGRVTGSYGHVDDLCDLMITAASSGAARGQVLNATGEAVSALDYVNVLADVVGARPDVVMIPSDHRTAVSGPLWSHLFDARHHAVLDTTRARAALGTESRFDIRSGHADTYRWFLDQGWARCDGPMVDPVWRSTWDFDAEAAVVAELR
jgi:nucleoside-diphosphate-sugar epimerase